MRGFLRDDSSFLTLALISLSPGFSCVNALASNKLTPVAVIDLTPHPGGTAMMTFALMLNVKFLYSLSLTSAVMIRVGAEHSLDALNTSPPYVIISPKRI